MSYLDKPIPTLEGEVAERFLEMARQNEEGANKIDFSEQIKSFEKIMEKSPLGGVNNDFVDPEMMHMSFAYCMNFGGPKGCFGHLHRISFNLYDKNGNELTDENRYTSKIHFKYRCDTCGYETILPFDPNEPTILY